MRRYEAKGGVRERECVSRVMTVRPSSCPSAALGRSALCRNCCNSFVLWHAACDTQPPAQAAAGRGCHRSPVTSVTRSLASPSHQRHPVTHLNPSSSRGSVTTSTPARCTTASLGDTVLPDDAPMYSSVLDGQPLPPAAERPVLTSCGLNAVSYPLMSVWLNRREAVYLNSLTLSSELCTQSGCAPAHLPQRALRNRAQPAAKGGTASTCEDAPAHLQQ